MRDKGFIPWDDDVDIGMPRPDFIRFGEIVKKKNFPNIFVSCTYQETPGYRLCAASHKQPCKGDATVLRAVEQEKEAWIDIFPS